MTRSADVRHFTETTRELQARLGAVESAAPRSDPFLSRQVIPDLGLRIEELAASTTATIATINARMEQIERNLTASRDQVSPAAEPVARKPRATSAAAESRGSVVLMTAPLRPLQTLGPAADIRR